ncbi:response regulator [Luteipulveratus mongoliensis]|uniref:Transcriptional regulatory protein n=1 Tax=Luteipulveratus mongoliensis TaxID=571913 RepID=A0A0K1JNG0_9MICO|nr:response regulator [Luteipulveratus mongoliensis]AKU18138.1 chemotaxis protein CheY [Luteipulveratus mongoliensis]
MSSALSVVIVDDDFMVARVHTKFVERIDGFDVVASASSGSAALDAIREHRPDLVLLDVHLPDMSGLEVLRTLRAEGDDVGVLMVTAERELESVRTAKIGGAVGYLVKPFTQEDLAQRLQEFLAQHRRLAGLEAPEQADIDQVFGSITAPAAEQTLPKGLSAATGELVLQALREDGELSAAACAERVGLSRVTARRYLEHFTVNGRVEVRQQYGRVGRPERIYRAT